MTHAKPINPAALSKLEAAYGPPSQAGFGSAVFHEQTPPAADLAQAAQAKYRFERLKATHSAGVTFQVDDFPEYFAALEQRKTLPAEVALSDPRTSVLADEYLIPLGISSMLEASIFIGGEMVGEKRN